MTWRAHLTSEEANELLAFEEAREHHTHVAHTMTIRIRQLRQRCIARRSAVERAKGEGL